jgi:hypothetical protein
MADNDIGGHLVRLLGILNSDAWAQAWRDLNLLVHDFKSLGLEPNAPDAAVWDACQAHEVVLVTANRNDDGPNSLEATIRARNEAHSLPVVTLADPDRVLQSPSYAERAAVRFLEILMDIDRYRGAGRLWVP